MVSIEYKNAYKEILEILQYVSKEEVNKIPQEMLQMFEQNANRNYDFKYNPNQTLQEQNVSKKTKYIIAILFRDYWATTEQRNKIIAKEKYDLEKMEEQKLEKYSYENLFKNRNQQIKENNVYTEQSLIKIEKEKFYKRVLRKILNIFNF